MADFSQTQIQEIPLDVRPHEGVSDKSGAIALQGIANAISGIGSIVSNQRANKQKQIQQGVLNQYQQELLTLANGVEQGTISSREAKTRSRAIFSQYSSDYPSLSGDISKIHKETMATPGLGQVIDKGTEQEQRDLKVFEDAVQKGYIPVNASAEQQASGMALYQESLRLETAWQHQEARIDNILKNRQLTQAQREDLIQQQQDASKRIIGESTDFWYRKTENELKNIVQTFQDSGDPTQALTQINILVADIKREANGFKAGPGGLDPSYVDNMTAPIFELVDAYKKIASGTESAEALANQIKVLQNRTQLNMLGDPEIAAVSSASKLLGESVVTSIIAGKKTVELLESIMDPTNVITLSKPEDRKATTKFGKEVATKYKDSSQEAKTEIDNVQNSVLDSIDANASMFEREGVKSLKDMFNYIASPEFGEYLKNGGKVTKQNLDNATAVIEKVYNDSLKGVLEKEFTNAKFTVLGVQSTGLKNEAVPNIITLTSENGVVKFTVKEDSISLPRDLEDAQLYASKLNKNVAPILQNVVNGYTHLQGSVDYQGTWDGLVSKILPDGSIDIEATESPQGSQGTQTPKDTQTPLSEAPNGSQTTSGGVSEGNLDVMAQFQQSKEEPEPVRQKLDIDDFSSVVEEELDVVQKSSDATPMLDLISAAEGTDAENSYNITLGYGQFLDGAQPDLTNMTLNEVREVQSAILSHPDNDLDSSAVGRYQITRTTLDDLKRQLKLSGDEKFTPELQDKLAQALLERRGLSKFKSGEISKEEFQRNLSKEWEGFVKDPTALAGIDQVFGGSEQVAEAPVGASKVDVFGATAYASEANNPLFHTEDDGHSHLVKPGASEKMAEVIAGPFQKAQEIFGKPIVINDAIAKKGTSREKETKGSRHFHGDALDISTKGLSNAEKIKLVDALKEAGFTGFGFGNTIIHADMGKKRGWAYSNKQFAGRPVSEMINRIKS